jgi:hypothetical protein
MSNNRSYKVKARPNLFDLAIMDGFLCGGGNAPSVQREAYWAKPSTQNALDSDLMDIKLKS